jgi:acyl-CoA synthetase (AMP-forming)/AMP-acid ligase II
MSETRVPLAEQLQRRAASHPERTLLHHRGRDRTYGEICAGAEGVAAWLIAHGVKPGDRVALVMPNCAEYVMGYFGIQLAGACAVTLDALQAGEELAYAINHSGSVAAILSPPLHERLARAEAKLETLRSVLLTAASKATIANTTVALIDEVTPLSGPRPAVALESPAQIIYTSGTTGRPKGVVLSHRNLAANTASIIASLSLREMDSVFAILAFSYSYGNSLLLTHVSCGGSVVVASDFVFWNDVLDLMERQKASGFAGIPSSFAMLVNRSDFLRRKWPELRYLTCAGGALPLPVIERLRESLPHVSLYCMYGQTEASARLSCLPPAEIERKLGSAGRAIPGVELTVRDESGAVAAPGELGEIVARGDNIMMGYFNDPQATAQVLRADGLHTGDMGRMDADGYLFITGRGDDVIKSGGYRIGPQEIEDAALQVAGVAEVGVTGIPDPMLGLVPVAFVVPVEPDASLVQRVRAHLEKVLARFKQPRDIHVVAKLPRTLNGKLQRRLLVELIPPPDPSNTREASQVRK